MACSEVMMVTVCRYKRVDVHDICAFCYGNN